MLEHLSRGTLPFMRVFERLWLVKKLTSIWWDLWWRMGPLAESFPSVRSPTCSFRGSEWKSLTPESSKANRIVSECPMDMIGFGVR